MSTSPNPSPLSGGRHPINISHLVMGIAFLGLTVVWALVSSEAVQGGDIRWLLPAPWLMAGAAGLVVTTNIARRRHSKPAESEYVETVEQETATQE